MERATHPARAVVTIPRTSSNRLTSRRGRQTRSSVGFGLAHDVGPEPEYAGAASVASGAASDRNSVNPGGVGTVRHAADPGLARMPRGRKTSLIPPGATAPESMIGSFTDRRVSNRDSAGVRHRERSGPAERVCCAHGRSEVDAGAATLHSAVLHYGSDPRRVRSGTCGTFQRSLLEPRGSRDVPPSVRSTCRNPQQGKWYLRNKVSYSSGASIMVSSRLSSKRCLQACA